MGMFDKDKEIGLIITRYLSIGEEFVLWSARIVREDFPTELGPAVQSVLTVSKVTSPDEKYDCTTLASSIAAKVKEAEPSDFPAVCSLAVVKSRYNNDALVIQFLKPYGRNVTRQAGIGAAQVNREVDPAPATAPVTGPSESAGEDDIPF